MADPTPEALRRLGAFVITRRRDDLGIRQDQLAHGPSTTTMTQIETGEKKVSDLSYRRLDQSLGWADGTCLRVLLGEDPVVVVAKPPYRLDPRRDLFNGPSRDFDAELAAIPVTKVEPSRVDLGDKLASMQYVVNHSWWSAELLSEDLVALDEVPVRLLQAARAALGNLGIYLSNHVMNSDLDTESKDVVLSDLYRRRGVVQQRLAERVQLEEARQVEDQAPPVPGKQSDYDLYQRTGASAGIAAEKAQTEDAEAPDPPSPDETGQSAKGDANEEEHHDQEEISE